MKNKKNTEFQNEYGLDKSDIEILNELKEAHKTVEKQKKTSVYVRIKLNIEQRIIERRKCGTLKT